MQVEARIDQDPDISRELSLWGQKGSEVIRGNLLVLPLSEGLLYVEPLFLKAERGELPELKRVIVSDGKSLAMEPTLAGALRVLAAEKGLAAQATRLMEKPAQPEDVPSIERAMKYLKEAREALRDGSWERFGQKMDALERILEEMRSRAGG
jgi:uncharacterized membrane protein (UPF0182 family)